MKQRSAAHHSLPRFFQKHLIWYHNVYLYDITLYTCMISHRVLVWYHIVYLYNITLYTVWYHTVYLCDITPWTVWGLRISNSDLRIEHRGMRIGDRGLRVEGWRWDFGDSGLKTEDWGQLHTFWSSIFDPQTSNLNPQSSVFNPQKRKKSSPAASHNWRNPALPYVWQQRQLLISLKIAMH